MPTEATFVSKYSNTCVNSYSTPLSSWVHYKRLKTSHSYCGSEEHLRISRHCCVLILLWLQVKLSLIHISLCWEVEMLQMNYTGIRWPESKHLASFAWDFPWAEEQSCTYSKRTKEGVFATGETQFKRGSLCKWWPELSYNMRPCNKDKMLWKDWPFEAIQGGGGRLILHWGI